MMPIDNMEEKYHGNNVNTYSERVLWSGKDGKKV